MKINFNTINRVRIADQNNKTIDEFQWHSVSTSEYFDGSKTLTIKKVIIDDEDEFSLFQKNKLELLNWAKSELSQEQNKKLGKTMNPYRSEKIKFLSKVIRKISDK